MQLNIKNQATRNLAVRLSEVTGESLTTAITKALEERLARVETPQEKAARWRRLAKASAPLWTDPLKTMDHGDLLYDEDGLPK
jgi:antitoxin VapB